jgi:hypothetical protein
MRGLTQSEKLAVETRPKPKSIDFLFDEKRKASWRVLLFVRQSPDEPDKTRLPIIDIFRAAKSKPQRGTIRLSCRAIDASRSPIEKRRKLLSFSVQTCRIVDEGYRETRKWS